MAAYDSTRAMQAPSMAYIASDNDLHEAAKAKTTKTCRGRKPNNKATTAQKKEPQRGMGVAKLERLRLEERWKKMTEMPPLDSHHLHHQYYSSPHLALTEPIPSVPVLRGVANYGVPVYGGGGLMGLDQGVMIQRVGNGGGFGGACGGGSGYNNSDLTMVQVGTSMSLAEPSNELSSMPKIQPQWTVAPERCDICLKKKRFNGQNTGFNCGKDKYGEISQINGSEIHGFNQQNNINVNGGISGFGARAAMSAFYSSHNLNHEGVEVMAIHRNVNSRGRNVLMEYEFFPEKDGRSTCSKEMELPAEASVAVGGEASCFTSTAYGVNAASNSVDLSLKLSY